MTMKDGIGWTIALLLWIALFVFVIASAAKAEDETRWGVYMPGWDAPAVYGAHYQQTFVDVCEEDPWVVTYRIGALQGNVPFVYLEQNGHTLAETLTGQVDHCWAEVLDRVPQGSTVAPFPEMNGRWVDWYSDDPADFINAFAHVQSLTDRLFIWCWAPARWGQEWWKYAPATYDVLCPSVFPAGPESGSEIAQAASDMGFRVEKGVILAQTGTLAANPFDDAGSLTPPSYEKMRSTQEIKLAWLEELLEAAKRERIISDVIYFNAGAFAFPEGWPL